MPKQKCLISVGIFQQYLVYQVKKIRLQVSICTIFHDKNMYRAQLAWDQGFVVEMTINDKYYSFNI